MSGALLTRGPLRARFAQSASDVEAAQRLRHAAFHGTDGVDADGFDGRASHVLVERDGRLLSTFRFQRFADAGAAKAGYSAQFYDLVPLAALPGPMIEMGRFCLAPGLQDPDAVRIGWAAITRIVDAAGAALLFGCSSFRGVAPEAYADSLRLLRDGHLGPASLRPVAISADRCALPSGAFDRLAAQRQMPPLLRTYLLMGGWVSDHLVIDRAMNTLHVFTGVEIARVPPARARLLRDLAGD